MSTKRRQDRTEQLDVRTSQGDRLARAVGRILRPAA